MCVCSNSQLCCRLQKQLTLRQLCLEQVSEANQKLLMHNAHGHNTCRLLLDTLTCLDSKGALDITRN